jgi:hypothetical protein
MKQTITTQLHLKKGFHIQYFSEFHLSDLGLINATLIACVIMQ